MVVLGRRQEGVRAFVCLAERELAVPRPDPDIGDRIIRAGDIFAVRKAAVENVELAFGFHRIAVDRIFNLYRGISEEMAEAAAQEGRTAHLPEEPGERLGPLRTRSRQELAELLRQVDQDCSGFEDSDRLGAATVDERRDLR